MRTARFFLFGAALAALVYVTGCAPPDPGAAGEWRHHGADLASTKYSALDQINAENFAQLEVAWRWESADARLQGAYDTGSYTATPLMVGGTVYAATSHGQVAALDPSTGEQLWLYDPRSWARELPTQLPRRTRGIEYWTDGEAERILIATLGKQLVSIDAATGKPDPAFGDNGMVDLIGDLGDGDWVTANISHSAPPIVVRDTVVVGSKIHDYVSHKRNPPGHIRAYDVRTGELKWRFHTIPQEGEPFTETWGDESWRWQGNTNAWTMLAADEELGHVYIPLSTPTNDYYGGDRVGDNLFAESIVCLDVETGERVWHFQTVHHGIWDYDIGSAPNVMDIVVDGKPIKALAQVSKTAFAYVFDRITGEPVWPIEDRPVPQSTVPGEVLSPTQPFPTKPPAFDRQGATEDDLIDFTPELREEALKIASSLKLGPIFEPLIIEGEDGKLGTLVVPGAGGGASFPGASVDPDTGILYVDSFTGPTGISVVRTADNVTQSQPEPGTSEYLYELKYQPVGGPQGLPLLKPPYRRLTGIDMNTGEHVFQVAQGPGPKDHPAIRHLDLPDLGSSHAGSGAVAQGGILVTKTILVDFLPARIARPFDPGQSQAEAADGTEAEEEPETGGHLRALDKATGAVLAEVWVDRHFHGAPMTYWHDGRQYIAVAGGGGREPAELVAMALPR